MTKDAIGQAQARGRARVGRGSSVYAVLLLGALIAGSAAIALGACGGSDDDSGGSAGSAPAVTPGLGQRCTGDCLSGLVCSTSGLFPRQCSAQCSGLSSCSMLAPTVMTACYGSGTQECGLKCALDAACPTGTHCGSVGGQMGCLANPQ